MQRMTSQLELSPSFHLFSFIFVCPSVCCIAEFLMGLYRCTTENCLKEKGHGKLGLQPLRPPAQLSARNISAFCAKRQVEVQSDKNLVQKIVF